VLETDDKQGFENTHLQAFSPLGAARRQKMRFAALICFQSPHPMTAQKYTPLLPSLASTLILKGKRLVSLTTKPIKFLIQETSEARRLYPLFDLSFRLQKMHNLTLC
jgi:hypothetical protein